MVDLEFLPAGEIPDALGQSQGVHIRMWEFPFVGLLISAGPPLLHSLEFRLLRPADLHVLLRISLPPTTFYRFGPEQLQKSGLDYLLFCRLRGIDIAIILVWHIVLRGLCFSGVLFNMFQGLLHLEWDLEECPKALQSRVEVQLFDIGLCEWHRILIIYNFSRVDLGSHLITIRYQLSNIQIIANLAHFYTLKITLFFLILDDFGEIFVGISREFLAIVLICTGFLFLDLLNLRLWDFDFLWPWRLIMIFQIFRGPTFLQIIPLQNINMLLIPTNLIFFLDQDLRPIRIIRFLRCWNFLLNRIFRQGFNIYKWRILELLILMVFEYGRGQPVRGLIFGRWGVVDDLDHGWAPAPLLLSCRCTGSHPLISPILLVLVLWMVLPTAA